MALPTTVKLASPLFGEPTLLAVRNSDAVWARGAADTLYLKSTTGWLANLYGGVQSGDDFAALYVPVDELPLPDLGSVQWSYYMAQAQSAGVNMVIWVHNPNDFDKRAELTQIMAGVEKGLGWNAHELDPSTKEFFYYGEGVSGADICVSEEEQYTLAQFQADACFSKWTIFRISFEFGWEASGTFLDAWVADIKINSIMIPLQPDSGGTGRIGRRHFTQVGAGALSGSLAPKTPFRLLSLDIHSSATPAAAEPVTLTKDAQQGEHFDTLISSTDMENLGVSSVYEIFEALGIFGPDDILVLAQANTGPLNWGVTIVYQTVFPA